MYICALPRAPLVTETAPNVKCYLSHSVVHPCSHFHATATPCSHFHAAATPCSHFHAAISMQHPLPAAARRHDRHQHDHQHRRPTQCSPRCTRAALSATKQKKHEQIGGTYFWLVPLLVTIFFAVVSSLFFLQCHYFFCSLHYFLQSHYFVFNRFVTIFFCSLTICLAAVFGPDKPL